MACASASVLAAASPVAAQPAPPRRALLFLLDRASFEEVLAVPEFRALARAGGAGMLSRRRHPDDGGLGAFLTIGAGAKAAVPWSRIAAVPGETAFPPDTFAAIQAANDSAVPGLLAQLLIGAGYSVRVHGNADDRFGPNAPGLLVGMDLAGVAQGRIHGAVVPRPDRLGGFRTDYAELAKLVNPPRDGRGVRADLTVVDLGDAHRIDQEARYAREGVAARERARALASAGMFVERAVRAAGGTVLVVVVTPSESQDMRDRGDVVTPIVLAEGRAASLFPAAGVERGLTSDSTRHPGIVLAEDVAPTILEFLGASQPVEMTGAPIRRSGMAPFAAHARHLEHRRIRVGVQVGFGLAALAVTLAGGTIAQFRRSASRRTLAAMGLAAAAAAAVPLALLAMGLLPHLRYAQVVPLGVAVTAGSGLIVWRFRDRDPAFPVLIVAAVTGLAVVADGLFGWRAASTSLAGGTVFEGRAYGIRNLWVGPVLGATILVSSRLGAARGLALGLGVAAFVGFPGLGSDVGGYLTVSAAAWLLYFSLSRGRLGVRELAITGAATFAGLVALLVVDGMLNPTPTHAGRFAQRVAADGIGTFVGVGLERLGSSLRTINQVPPAWLLVGWFVAAAWMAPRVGGPVGAAFDRSPGYREAMSVLAVASLIAIIVNDSGISTAQAAAAYSLGGFVIAALAFRESAARRAAPPPPLLTETRVPAAARS